MQRLQHYNIVASLQDLHCCISSIYFTKNALKDKSGKQAPHNLIFFMILLYLIDVWETVAGKQQQEV